MPNLTSLALKSRAKLTRSLPRPGKRWLQYLFKDHKPTAKFTSSLRDEEDAFRAEIWVRTRALVRTMRPPVEPIHQQIKERGTYGKKHQPSPGADARHNVFCVRRPVFNKF